MAANRVIRLQDRKEKEIWREACATLWIEVFGDKEQYVDHYMDSTWKRNQVLLMLCRKSWIMTENGSHESEAYPREEEIASMLHMNPYTLTVKDETVNVHYIVGVCTRETLRGRGYMDILLKKALHMLKEQGEPFAYLMPADEKIYLPYQFVPAGFTEERLYSVFLREEESAEAGAMAIPFKNLSTEERNKVIRLMEMQRGDVYVPPDEEYLQDLEEQMQTCDGEMITIWRESELIGAAAYLHEEGEIPVEVIQFVAAGGCDEGVREVLHRHICERLRVESIRIQYDEMYRISDDYRMDSGELHAAHTAHRHCTTMIRCLDPEWFLRRLPSRNGWGQNCTVAVNDNTLAENNRVYRVVFGKDGEKNEVTPCQSLPEHCMDVETLVKYVIKDLTVYTPELV